MPRVFLVKKKWSVSSTEKPDHVVTTNVRDHTDNFPQSEKGVMEIQVESFHKGNTLSREPIPAFHVETDIPQYTALKSDSISSTHEHVRENPSLYFKHHGYPNDRHFLPHALPHFSTGFPIFGNSHDLYFHSRPRDSLYSRTLDGYRTVTGEIPLINGCHNGYLRNDGGKLCLHHSAFKPTSANIGGSLELLYNLALNSNNSRIRDELLLQNEALKKEQRQRETEEIRRQEEHRRHREKANEVKAMTRTRNAQDTSTQWEKIKFLNDTMADISKYFNFEKDKSRELQLKHDTKQISSEHSKHRTQIIKEMSQNAQEVSKPEFDDQMKRTQDEVISTKDNSFDITLKKMKKEVVSEDEEEEYNIPSSSNLYQDKSKDFLHNDGSKVREDIELTRNFNKQEVLTTIGKQEARNSIFPTDAGQEQILQVKIEEKNCGSGNQDEKELEEGANVKTEVKPNPQLKYKCDECGKAFSRSTTLVTHQRIHSGDKPFVCGECGRAFRQPGNLTRHRLTHTSLKPHVCSQCGKAFNRASNLQTHMRTHSNDKPFHCDFCGKGFNQKIDMKIHRYIHTGEKPHRCQKCGRGFKQLTHLTYHMRTHSDVRMYHCQYCGKGFNQKGNLQAHIYGHTGERPFKCDVCGKGFTLTSTLNTHKRIHAPKKPFQCKFCDKAFYQKNALKTHYISSHPCIEGESIL